MNELEAMERAIMLALRGSGYVSPNPRVGCVILKDGRVIGEGWHEEFGGKHAEVNAIESAKESVEGATLVVNLEPCSHTGKQPPCVDTIIEHKIARVVVGMTDPNPMVMGSGIERLRLAGIEVEVGLLHEECQWVNRFFVKNIHDKTPYIIAKIGQSIDGCISTSRGESKWITGSESRKRVHALRAEIDAVLIGRMTALSDDPELTTRDVKGNNPKRIVLDTHLSLPLTIKLFTDVHRKNTYVCCNKRASMSRKADNLRVAGVNVLGVDESSDSTLSLQSVIATLTQPEIGITSLMIEGGSQILSSFLQQDLVDEFHLFTAPIIIGNGKHGFSNLFTPTLMDARNFAYKAVSKSGDDIHIILTRA